VFAQLQAGSIIAGFSIRVPANSSVDEAVDILSVSVHDSFGRFNSVTFYDVTFSEILRRQTSVKPTSETLSDCCEGRFSYFVNCCYEYLLKKNAAHKWNARARNSREICRVHCRRRIRPEALFSGIHGQKLRLQKQLYVFMPRVSLQDTGAARTQTRQMMLPPFKAFYRYMFFVKLICWFHWLSQRLIQGWHNSIVTPSPREKKLYCLHLYVCYIHAIYLTKQNSYN